MQVEINSWRASTRVGAQVQGGPVVPMPYSLDGKKYRVEHVHITFTLDIYGNWMVVDSYKINLSGPVLKKDGTDSKNLAKGPASAEWETADDWAWLRELVDDLRPLGSPERDCPERFEIASGGEN